MKIKTNFRVCFLFFFHFLFGFYFCFPNVFAFLLTQRDLEVSQTVIDWPRSAIAFLLNPRDLKVPQTVNSLLLGREVTQHFHLRIFHVAQRCHRWSTLSRLVQKYHSTQKYSTQSNSNMQNSMMLLTFFVFNWKYPFQVNLVQII